MLLFVCIFSSYIFFALICIIYMKVKERNEKLDSFSLIRIKSLNISICQFFMTHENKIEMIT